MPRYSLQNCIPLTQQRQKRIFQNKNQHTSEYIIHTSITAEIKTQKSSLKNLKWHVSTSLNFFINRERLSLTCQKSCRAPTNEVRTPRKLKCQMEQPTSQNRLIITKIKREKA